VLSSEPKTVLSLADRIIVLKRGSVVREFAGETISKDRLLEAWRPAKAQRPLLRIGRRRAGLPRCRARRCATSRRS
jgi:ABC-type glutathione transport system ATPase component